MGNATISRRAALAALAAGATARTAVARTRARRPNVLFILADDLGVHDISCFGRPDFQTPHIDTLARDGVKLTASYANSCTCSPTRTALLSGRYQYRLPVGNYDPLIRADIGFPPEHPTLASLLRNAGYRTGLIGKWHLGVAPLFGPLKSGYDEFFGLMGGAIDYFSHDLGTLAGPPRTPDLYENETPVVREGYATDLFTERALAFIEANRARPFFLSLHYNAPHWPWQSRTDPGAPRANDFHFDGGSPSVYAQMMAALDEGVGAALAALDTHGLRENTIVIFTSDNGGERFSYQWPLRGEKTTLYEGGIRVPTLVRWPGGLPANSTCDGVNITMDWLPTLLRVAGARPHPRYPSDGADIMRMLAGAPPRERTLHWRAVDQAAARRGQWKYLRFGDLEYLFDLNSDPGERANLRQRHADVFESLRSAYRSWDASMLPIPDDARIDPAILRRLEALRPPY